MKEVRRFNRLYALERGLAARAEMRDERYSKFCVSTIGGSEMHYGGGVYDEVDFDVGDLGGCVEVAFKGTKSQGMAYGGGKVGYCNDTWVRDMLSHFASIIN